MGRHRVATAIVLWGLLGCREQSPLAPDVEHSPFAADVPLEIYLLDDFRHEPVDVAVDGKQLYTGTVGAVPFSGPAVTINAIEKPGRHRLEVRVAEQHSTSELVLAAPTYVIITLGEQNLLRITVTREQPFWM
ncbi:MAG TPA: hypothetical protein VFE28_01375 [Candidatus Krumholzibacteria bacterium]|nr:hypothetical protein [Candidatus Krumholzibacteria bacterium]